MGRRRKYSDGFSVKSFSYPLSEKHVLDKLEELAKIEGLSVSELIWKIIKEYVNRKHLANTSIAERKITVKGNPEVKVEREEYKDVYIIRCPSCGYTVYATRKPYRGQLMECLRCGRRWFWQLDVKP